MSSFVVCCTALRGADTSLRVPSFVHRIHIFSFNSESVQVTGEQEYTIKSVYNGIRRDQNHFRFRKIPFHRHLPLNSRLLYKYKPLYLSMLQELMEHIKYMIYRHVFN
jgi:hypothetical protein